MGTYRYFVAPCSHLQCDLLHAKQVALRSRRDDGEHCSGLAIDHRPQQDQQEEAASPEAHPTLSWVQAEYICPEDVKQIAAVVQLRWVFTLNESCMP